MALEVNTTNLLAYVRDNADSNYQRTVSGYTGENLGEIGKQVTKDSNNLEQFLNLIITKIVQSNIIAKVYNNPLARLKKASVPMGQNLEEIFINPATDAGYDNTQTLLLKTTKPDGKVAYYGLNRKSCYPVTIPEDEVLNAFNSEQEFMSFYNGCITSLYAGDEIDEFYLCKKVISKCIDNGVMKLVTSDLSQPKTLAKNISNMSSYFSFPNDAFCGYNNVPDNQDKFKNGEKKCITFCRPDRQVLLMRSDVQNEINYEVLATMFHMEVAKLEAMTILVDSFPTSEKYDIYCILCDEDAFQIRDMKLKITSKYIESSLEYNVWLHHWEYIFLSMFGNCVAFGQKLCDYVGTITGDGATTEFIINHNLGKPYSQLNYTLLKDGVESDAGTFSSNNSDSSIKLTFTEAVAKDSVYKIKITIKE